MLQNFESYHFLNTALFDMQQQGLSLSLLLFGQPMIPMVDSGSEAGWLRAVPWLYIK